MLQAFFGLSADAAESIMGSVGRGFTPAIGDEPAKLLQPHATFAPALLTFDGWWQRSVTPETPEARAALWKTLDDVREEREQELQAVTLKALRKQVKRIVARLKRALASQRSAMTATGETVGETKALSAADWVTILDSTDEANLIKVALQPRMLRIHTDAVIDTAKRMGVEIDAAKLAKQVQALAAETAKRMQETTDKVVRDIVETGLGEGTEVAQLVTELGHSKLFSTARSSLVARTATTRTLNQASVAAMGEAEKQGVRVQKEWLATSDDLTRDTHSDLDGQVRNIDEAFTSSGGGEAMHPGDFGQAEEDINCRCVVLPKVED